MGRKANYTEGIQPKKGPGKKAKKQKDPKFPKELQGTFIKLKFTQFTCI